MTKRGLQRSKCLTIPRLKFQDCTEDVSRRMDFKLKKIHALPKSSIAVGIYSPLVVKLPKPWCAIHVASRVPRSCLNAVPGAQGTPVLAR